MNVQAHMSGQISGQVSNQLPQQSGNPLPPPLMQNLGGGGGIGGSGGGDATVNVAANMYSVEPEFDRTRLYMRDKIFGVISQRSLSANDQQKRKYKELAKRLEEGLFKTAQTNDEYMTLNTLENRLSCLVKRHRVNSHNQQHLQLVNSDDSAGTMIPTPGMSHGGNSNLMVSSVDTVMIASSGCDSIAPTTVNTGSLLSSSGMLSGSFSRSDGTLSNGYQQSPANFSISSGGNMPSNQL